MEQILLKSDNTNKDSSNKVGEPDKINENFKQINTPILYNKLKKKIHIKPLKYIYSDSGKDRHFTPAAQEWYNSIYSYNNNYVKSLPVSDNHLMKLLKSFFNSRMNWKTVKNQTKPLTNRYKRLTTKRVFVGKGELKHTSSKVIITCYIYNAEGMFLSANFNRLSKGLFSPHYPVEVFKLLNHNGEDVIKTNRDYTYYEFLILPDHHEIYYSYIIAILDKLRPTIWYLNHLSNLVDTKVVDLDEKFSLYNDKIRDIKNIYYPDFKTYMKMAELEYMKYWEMYKLLLNNNKIKFSKYFTDLKLIKLLKHMYNKNVELNVVNLKKMHLNSDIFTQVISLKLRNRDNRLYKVLLASYRKTKIPEVSRISERISKSDKNTFFVNKIRNSLITNMFNDDIRDPLNNLISDFFPSIDSLETINIKRRCSNKRSISLVYYVLRSLKHLKLRGIRIEAKGRLTRRFTAARSIFKLRWKGGLKNVDSSFRGLSTIMLRGTVKSNVQYSLITSKNRNGAYGVKSWVSSK